MNRVRQFLGNFRFLPGPIIAVELVTTARRKWHYVLRSIYALLLLFAVYANYPSDRYGNAVTISMIANSLHFFFGVFGVMQILAVLCVGPAMAAGTIATERERRTIEYLFTSTLNDAEIILGKLSARLLGILYLILAGIPVLAAATLLGGIAQEALFLLFVITFSTATYVAVMSVSISAFSKRARDAVVSTYLVLIVLIVVVWLLKGVVPWHIIGFSETINFLMDAHPLATFLNASEFNSPAQASRVLESVYRMVQNQVIIAGSLLVFTTLFMRKAHLRQSGAGTKKPRWRFRLFAGRLGDSPMLWKELWAEPAARLGLVGFLALAIVYATVLGLTCCLTYQAIVTSSTANGPYEVNGFITAAAALATAVACGALLIIAARSASAVSSEKERDCWDSLISTSLDAGEIVSAKIVGSVWAVRGALPLMLVAWLPAIVVAPQCLVAIGFHFLTWTIVAFFAAALGVQISLGSKNSMRAMAATVAISLYCGGGYLFCCIPCVAPLTPGLREGSILFVSGFVPYLLFMPTLFVFEHGSRSEESAMFVLAYLIGNCGYAVAAALLYASTVERFDRLSGRTHPRHSPSLPMVENRSVQQSSVDPPASVADIG